MPHFFFNRAAVSQGGVVVSTEQAHGAVRAILDKVAFESNFAPSVLEVWVMRDDDPPRRVF
jgi:hypothetical protein